MILPCSCLRPLARSFATSSRALAAAPKVVGSCVAGTRLKGLNFLKAGEDPVALEDAEYPPWLWTLLGTEKVTVKAKKGKGVAEESLAERLDKEKLRLKKAGRLAIKGRNELKL